MTALGCVAPSAGPPRGTPIRISAATARALCERRLAPARAASSSTTMAPRLCRLPEYEGPGLPSPTISQGVIRSIRSPGMIRASYTHLRAHETVLDLVCRLLLE